MPYLLSPLISQELPGLWGEGAPLEIENIYDIHSDDPKKPPVHYNSYHLKPHSLPHVDAPGHIIPEGKKIEDLLRSESTEIFYGRTLVVKLKGNRFQLIDEQAGLYVWKVNQEELFKEIYRLCPAEKIPRRILVTANEAPLHPSGFHDPNYVLVLEKGAAEALVEIDGFCLYGTSWKSADFEPGSRERPVHKVFFEKGAVMEMLKLDHVPEGEYFMSAFPVPIQGATESIVCPVLYTKEELSAFLR